VQGWNHTDRSVGVSLDDRGFVETDDGFETTADGVYAVGDVSGQPMFTHAARDDADLLYRHLANDEDISTEGRTSRGRCSPIRRSASSD